MTCPHIPESQALMDGALDGEAAVAAARHLETCAECQAAVEDAAMLGHAIRTEATYHDAPAGLAARVTAALDAEDAAPPPRRRFGLDLRSLGLGAAGGVGASMLAACLALFVLAPPSPQTLAQQVSDAHVRALMDGKLIAVVSSSHHTVKPWFAGRVAVSPPVADFADQGFTLVGGRVDRIAGADAAVVVYAHGAHHIDLFAWPDRGAPLTGEGLRHGWRWIGWRQGDLDLAAVSDVQDSELQRFVNLVRQQRE